jgi:putative phosphoesterase
MGSATRILVVADTHNRLPANVGVLAAGVDEIWHLGDVCAPTVLDELRLLGPPVIIVRGNCDSEISWPTLVDFARHGVRFRLQHIPPPARHTPNDCDVLLHGHTHVPRDETISRVRFLNPGCVTRPNRGAPPSVAYLGLTKDGEVEWNLVRLS